MAEDTNEEIDNKVGLGVDIVQISRMQKILEDTPSFAEFTFSEEEIKYCTTYPSRSSEHFSTHFAAKEAVLKALGCGFAEKVGPRDVEVMHDAKGRPFAVLHGAVKEIADNLNIIDLPISLSFTNSEAVAVAIAIKEGSSLQKKVLNKSKDPVSELTRQFKKAKKILEEQNFNEIKNENSEQE